MKLKVNSVYQIESLDGLIRLKSKSVDLIYIDPPFFTQRILHGAASSFDDVWPSLQHYLDFIQSLVQGSHRVLKDSGSILLHCDWRTSHRIRCLLDGVFGSDNFVNCVVWQYGLGGVQRKCFSRKHDDILFYSKTVDYFFDPPMVNKTNDSLERKICPDVINQTLSCTSPERTGYPTQKPLKLLVTLVSACSPKGGLVVDPCCGSGTSLVAARLLGREYIGFDINPDAVSISTVRLVGELSVGYTTADRPKRSLFKAGS